MEKNKAVKINGYKGAQFEVIHQGHACQGTMPWETKYTVVRTPDGAVAHWWSDSAPHFSKGDTFTASANLYDYDYPEASERRGEWGKSWATLRNVRLAK